MRHPESWSMLRLSSKCQYAHVSALCLNTLEHTNRFQEIDISPLEISRNPSDLLVVKRPGRSGYHTMNTSEAHPAMTTLVMDSRILATTKTHLPTALLSGRSSPKPYKSKFTESFDAIPLSAAMLAHMLATDTDQEIRTQPVAVSKSFSPRQYFGSGMLSDNAGRASS